MYKIHEIYTTYEPKDIRYKRQKEKAEKLQTTSKRARLLLVYKNIQKKSLSFSLEFYGLSSPS